MQYFLLIKLFKVEQWTKEGFLLIWIGVCYLSGK